MADQKIAIRVTVNGTQAKNELDQLDRKTGQIGTTGKKSFSGLESAINPAAIAAGAMAAAIAGIGVALDAVTDIFGKFETRIKNVESLGVNNIEQLRSEMLSLATDAQIPIGINDMTDGLYQIVSAGVDAGNQIRVLEATAKAGVAGLATTSEAINLSAAVIKGYGAEWSEVDNVMDLAFQTVKLGQTTFPELASSMGQVVPLANTLEISMQELFGAYATLTGVTGNTSEVTTQLRAILTATAKPTKDMTAFVQGLGFASAEAAIKQLGLAGFMQLLQNETQGSATKMGSLLRRVEATNAALALSGPQYDTFVEKSEAMKNASGAATDAFAIQSKTYENSVKVLDNAIDNAAITIGQMLVPAQAEMNLALAGFINDLDWDLMLENLDHYTTTLQNLYDIATAVVGGIYDLYDAIYSGVGAVIEATGVLDALTWAYDKLVSGPIAAIASLARGEVGLFGDLLHVDFDKLEEDADGIDEYIADIMNRVSGAGGAEPNAPKVNTPASVGVGGGGERDDNGMADFLASELEALDMYHDESLTAIEEFDVEALDLYQQKLDSQLDMLTLMREAEILTESEYRLQRDQMREDEYNAIVAQYGRNSEMARRFALETQKIRVKEAEQDRKQKQMLLNNQLTLASQVMGSFTALTGAFAQQSETGFKIHKAASIVEATVNGIKAAIASYNWAANWGGPPAGAIAAAAAGLQTGVMIANIASQEMPSYAYGTVVTEPRFAQIGDGRQAGASDNTEFILNSPQMQQVLTRAITASQAEAAGGGGLSIDALREMLVQVLDQYSPEMEFKVEGSDLYAVLRMYARQEEKTLTFGGVFGEQVLKV
jgi:TP901 family phage tail tape measure protein